MTVHPVGLAANGACAHCAKGYENHEYNCTGGCMADFRVRTIGFCGPAGAGKSTAADRLAKRWRFSRVRFAAPLKAMLAALGLSAEHLDGALKEEPTPLLCGRSPRQAMQWLGTEWGRNLIGDEFWIEAWRAAIERTTPTTFHGGFDPIRLIVADDVRFANEAKAIRERGGIVVKIERPGSGSSSGGDHASERLEFTPDRVIHNHGDLAALRAEIDALALSLR
ncbi:hypothetical protein FQV39_28830 [Bosea sp. F3-2]|uniref:deoxynucleotide monophosphate kinase family protein n=1 Tax=Bosea sp. F3-2 TaxID=2599640 RepID=UPI0011EBA04D|nr:hypothetical protein [Bosea sp. F3-2]QEL26169.1 hypothetical protein FQV39_28830 [Bosea sp. F3-2]